MASKTNTVRRINLVASRLTMRHELVRCDHSGGSDPLARAPARNRLLGPALCGLAWLGAQLSLLRRPPCCGAAGQPGDPMRTKAQDPASDAIGWNQEDA